MRTRSVATFFLSVGLCCGLSTAGVLVNPVEAPEWKTSEWINGAPGRVSTLKGRVLLIDFFQLWCPGCNSFSIPLFQSWAEKYGGRDDIMVLSIHTVFEGHSSQTPERLKAFIRDWGITHPVGIDAYESPGDEVPITMKRFETKGTPHVVIVDKQGLIRFSHFGEFAPEPVEFFIERLLEERDTGKSGLLGSQAEKAQEPKGSRVKRGRKTDKPTRTDRPSAPPAAPAADDESRDEALSGKYKLTLEQSSKSCGNAQPTQTFLAEILVGDKQVEAEFSRPFLGIRELKADYDAATKSFRVESQRDLTERGRGMALGLELSGQFVASDPPELQYTFYFDKQGNDSAWDCLVEGGGKGTRTSATTSR